MLAALAGMIAAVLLAVTGRFGNLSVVGETTIAVGLGLFTMLAFAPWKRIIDRGRHREEIRRLTRLVREFDRDHDREPLRTFESKRADEIGELSRAIYRALTNATALRIEAHRLRRTMDDSIKRETHRATGRLQREAQTDPLTGLGNRRALEDQLGRLSEESDDLDGPLTALMIDIDRFKEVNDKLGHAVGDTCLAFLGKLLRSGLRDGDAAFRTGGDEFIVLMPGAPSHAGTRVADRISALFGQLAWTHGNMRRPTLSIGVATAPAGEMDDADELIRRADEAMYAAKQSGRARVTSWGDLRGAA
jgi:diguanylate cyclase (GGDEF)-like protein